LNNINDKEVLEIVKELEEVTTTIKINGEKIVIYSDKPLSDIATQMTMEHLTITAVKVLAENTANLSNFIDFLNLYATFIGEEIVKKGKEGFELDLDALYLKTKDTQEKVLTQGVEYLEEMFEEEIRKAEAKKNEIKIKVIEEKE